MLRGTAHQTLPISAHSVDRIKRASLKHKPNNAVFGASLALITFLAILLISSLRSGRQERFQPPSNTHLSSKVRGVRGTLLCVKSITEIYAMHVPQISVKLPYF